jgi:integrase
MATVVKRPSGKWQATVRKDGRSRSRSFQKRTDAMKWARETELSADRGLLTPASGAGAPEMTLSEVLRKYRDDVTSMKRCADNESYAINGFLRTNPKMAARKVGKLRSADFVAYRDIRLQSMKPATVVRELGWMQHALDVASTDWGQHLPASNPVRPVRRPKIDNRRERRLQAGEWRALLVAVNEARSPLIKPLLTLALATGMRRGELLSMQWKHVDLERRTVFLPQPAWTGP